MSDNEARELIAKSMDAGDQLLTDLIERVKKL